MPIRFVKLKARGVNLREADCYFNGSWNRRCFEPLF